MKHMVLDKEQAEHIVQIASGRKHSILHHLKVHGFEAEDDSVEAGYLNLKVQNPDGTMTRIYRTLRNEVKVQIWEPATYRYSGIPTFEPSGRRSF